MNRNLPPRPRRRRAPALLALAVALGAALLATSSCSQPASHPNVILISVDTLRADRLASYGGRAGLTGMMDFWAERGVRFANAYAPAPWTLPSHASALTGLYPTEHRAIDEKINIDKSAPMLAERLRNAGFVTGAFVSHYYLGEEYGFGRGFDEFFLKPDAKADDMIAKATRWVQKQKGQKPFFLFLHLFDPHTPYQPPVDIAKKHYPADVNMLVPGTTKDVVDVMLQWPSDDAKQRLRVLQGLYDGEVEFVDKQLEVFFKFLQEKGLESNTVLILMADHGEEFMEHGMMEHGFALYQEQLRVPFIWYYPAGLPAGLAVDEPASLIDLLPTLLDLLQLPPVDSISGRSLMPLVRKEKASLGRYLLAETTRQGPDRAAIVQDGAKYFYSPHFALNGRPFREMFFDLLNDPLEKNDLFAKERERAQKLAGQLLSSGLYVERRAWHLQWGTGPQVTKLKGEIRTSGKFIYEYKGNTIYGTDAKGLLVTREFPWDKKEDNKLTFVNVTPDSNGVSVMTEPETATVTMELLFGGKEEPGRILLGGPKNRAASGHLALSQPIPREPDAAPPPGGCLIWSDTLWVNSKQVLRAEVGDPIKLAPDVIEHLRSLGYVQ